MKRRNFLKSGMAGGALAAFSSAFSFSSVSASVISAPDAVKPGGELAADLVIIGGGLGGCAAAIAALRNGLRVVMTEETDWLGGQLTAQGVPPDEHRWIETHGATRLYRDFRTAVRRYYVDYYPMTEAAKTREYLNPGDGWVSRLCHEPRVALAVLEQFLLPYVSSGKLTVLLDHKATGASVSGDRVDDVSVKNLKTGELVELTAPYFIDATELGDLLPLTKTEFRTGSEAKSQTGELHAAETADPENQQCFTVCFAMDYDKDGSHVIDKPQNYAFWRDFVPQLTPPSNRPILSYPSHISFNPEIDYLPDKRWNYWTYRRIINKKNFLADTYVGDVTIVNWGENDYYLGNLIGSEGAFEKHCAAAKELSLSLLYWLQTEAPHPDGDGQGWPGLRLRPDVLGTDDGLAKYPYIRESRRIDSVFTILEEHVGKEQREKITGKEEDRAADFYDSVGLGLYPIDIHATSKGFNSVGLASLPFQIPMGALLPKRMKNLLPANKNLGTTHVTNGCYRLHPVEWGIGEAVGMVVAYALQKKTEPHAIRENETQLADFQNMIRSQGVETHWPDPL